MKLDGKILISLTPLALICAGWIFWAQSPSTGDSRNSKGNSNNGNTRQRQRIENLVDLAPSAPAEVAADVLLVIASSNEVTDKQRKIELLEDAFRIAANVREPVKQRSWSLLVDTRAGF